MLDTMDNIGQNWQYWTLDNMDKNEQIGQSWTKWIKLDKNGENEENGQFRQKMTNDRARKKFLEARCDARFLKKPKVFLSVLFIVQILHSFQ